MKGYKFLNSLESSKFIKKYEVIGDKIILYMHNGDKLEYQYSEEALARVDQMQEDAYMQYSEKELSKNNSLKGVHKALMIIFGDTAIALMLLIALFGPMIITVGLFSVSAVAFLTQMAENIKITKRIDELKKQKVYMMIKEELDGEILRHKNISQCLTNKKRKALLKQEKLTSSAFNLTSIDEVSLEDLENLRDNKERENELGFEADDVIGSKKGKIKIKSYHNGVNN